MDVNELRIGRQDMKERLERIERHQEEQGRDIKDILMTTQRLLGMEERISRVEEKQDKLEDRERSRTWTTLIAVVTALGSILWTWIKGGTQGAS